EADSVGGHGLRLPLSFGFDELVELADRAEVVGGVGDVGDAIGEGIGVADIGEQDELVEIVDALGEFDLHGLPFVGGDGLFGPTAGPIALGFLALEVFDGLGEIVGGVD